MMCRRRDERTVQFPVNCSDERFDRWTKCSSAPPATSRLDLLPSGDRRRQSLPSARNLEVLTSIRTSGAQPSSHPPKAFNLARMRSLGRLPLPIIAACLLLLPPSPTAFAGDTIAPGQTLRGGDTLSSANGTFELGFFNLGPSRNRYLGIWFKDIGVPTVAWVANRARPLTNASGVLVMRNNGTLVLLNEASEAVWSSGELSMPSPVAQLLDTGNFVVRDADSHQTQSFSWQSFDFPDRMFLPGAKMTAGEGFYAWTKDDEDPSPSQYHNSIDPHGDIIVYQGPGRKRYRTGPWNGITFSGIPEMSTYGRFIFNFVSNPNETYYEYEVRDRSLRTVLQITDAGVIKRLVWSNASKEWKEYWSGPREKCDEYAICGPFGMCNADYSFYCRCLPGFEPKSPKEWDLRDGSDGCVRRRELNCSGDGFYELNGVKLPDMSSTFINRSMGLGECREVCLRNCSCTAYTSANVSGAESGCFIWTGDLVDIKQYNNMGQRIYIRLEASELDSINGGPSKRKKVKIIASVLAVAISMLVMLSACCIWRKKRKAGTSKDKMFSPSTEEDMELPMFSWHTIATATDFFSVANKLGQGGFGTVYKGKLEDGQDIAVKRLSKNSVEGVDEFKNEIKLIIKLQHRNLVRLLGCCIEGDETMLVYEYLPNKSLDTLIFDKRKSTLLDWQTRFDIVLGIARGLLYLHQDSRLRIIHRDLKASNVLLDEEMKPKISDFGTARIFKGGEMEENTRRVVGTYGYMSPEYAMDGIFSVKSDVFSFGVLLLEIISGKKNRGVYQSDPKINLLGHAWGLWNDGNCLELLDKSIDHPYSVSEIIRCIQIGLLCVQEHAEDRPTMTSVVLMLGSNSMALPMPKRPGFCAIRGITESDWSSIGQQSSTITDITLTEVEGR